ncbi:MAG: hypothetical protein WCK67_13230 [bacterium]
MNKILSNKTVESTKYLPHFEEEPDIHPSATIRNSIIEGKVHICENVHIVNAAIRADEGTPFYIGKNSNIQDFAVLHAYCIHEYGNDLEQNKVYVENKGYFAIYIDEKVSLSHGVLVHGPSYVGKNSFIGFKATIDGANVGENVEIGAHAYIKNVTIPDNTAIMPNAVITKEEDIEKYIINSAGINKRIVNVNIEMAEVYK